MVESNRRQDSVPASLPQKSQNESQLRLAWSRTSQTDEQDGRAKDCEEAEDKNIAGDGHNWTGSSGKEQRFVAFEPNDPENPYNWSFKRKAVIIFSSMMAVLNSTLASSLPSNAVPYMAKEWGVTSEPQKVLPISMFLVGYIVGPIIWAPMSEQFGRRLLTIAAFVMFCFWSLACALAPSWPAFLVFRLLLGAFASSPIALVAGIMADLYNEPQARGRAMAAFMATTFFGSVLAPIISGFCSPTIGWRWSFWIGLIYACLSLLLLLLFLPETSGPIILVRRAQQLRRADPNSALIAPHETKKLELRDLVTRVLTRPIRMLFTELLVSATCVYLALCYAIFYMTFGMFPIIYEDLYGLSPGVEGLCFLPIGAGTLAALAVFYGWDAYHRKAVAEQRPWARREECRRLPLACLGGPLFVISLFWLGWTARKDVSFVAPMLSGVPFGMGFTLIFMALINFLADAYEIYAASASAATSCTRSLLATVLPFALTPMFNRLGISGACSVLGGISCVMCIIPFVFIWKGETLRERSTFCTELRKAKEERRRQEGRREVVPLEEDGKKEGSRPDENRKGSRGVEPTVREAEEV